MVDKKNIFMIVDSIWCRTLCVLERMEIVIDKCIKRTTLCHDNHPDKENPSEPISDMEEEFKIQLQALERGWFPIKSDLSYFENDLYEWYAGREQLNLPKSKVDDLAYELLKRIKGDKSDKMMMSPSNSSPSRRPMAAPKIQGGEIFLPNSSHSHKRGDLQEGIRRFERLFMGRRENKKDNYQDVLK